MSNQPTEVDPINSVPAQLSERQMRKWEKYKDYEAEFESPLRVVLDPDEVWFFFPLFSGIVGLVSTIVMAAMAANSALVWWAVPIPIVSLLTVAGAIDLPKRFLYRKNLIRDDIVVRVKNQIKRMLSFSYNLKPIGHTKSNIYRLAYAMLLNKSASAFFKGKDKRTNVIQDYTLEYSHETKTFELSCGREVVSPLRKAAVTVSASNESTLAVGKELPASEQLKNDFALPTIKLDTLSLKTLPQSIQSRVKSITETYSALQESPLTAEDSYVVGRAGTDLQEAVSLFQSITRLRGEDAEEIVTKLLDKLLHELEEIRNNTLTTAMHRIKSKQLYVEER